ncbi:DUF1851 domain-containing protein [bacterium BFN5]|nr:DUF1851 domain-containing protein [bacterium BFN5]
MFNTLYKRNSGPEITSVLQRLGIDVATGVYNNGLLMVLDEKESSKIMADWDWLFRERVIALITTGLGNVFLLKQSSSEIFYLDTQGVELIFITSEISWFINEFLIKSIVLEDVILWERIEKLILKNRPLEYLETFILEPWIIFGGEDKLENYGIGDCDVYISLLGQTYEPLKS